MKTPKMFTYLEAIAPLIPAPIFWLDIDGVTIGANDLTFKVVGATPEKILNKGPYDYYPKEIADMVMQNIQKVVQEKRTVLSEEAIADIETGKVRYFLTTRSPLYDDDGINIIGVIGTSVEITDRKRLEEARLEIERQKVKIEEQEKFAEIVSRAVHDMQAPLLGLNSTYLCQGENLPEKERILLRDSVNSVNDIANHLKYRYVNEIRNEKEKPEPVLVNLELSNAMSSKRYQFKDRNVTFSYECEPNSIFVFIKIKALAFERLLSNLIKNAIEALESKPGNIWLKLSHNDEEVKIVIKDNGKGIPNDVLFKIRNNEMVTSDKEGGSGIGMGQVRDTLREAKGIVDIESELGKGTEVTLTFPIIATPDYLAQEICLNEGDIIVVLDDDPSVHEVWDIKLESYVNVVTIKHFKLGQEAISFINDSRIDKNKVVLLADFELLKQKLNGLDVVKETKIANSILVTSHFKVQAVQRQAIAMGTKLLPKELVSDAPIRLLNRGEKSTEVTEEAEASNIVVLVEDNRMAADGLVSLFSKYGKEVYVYYNGNEFLKNFKKYPKNAHMCLDYTLGDMTGVDIGKKLHRLGYDKLYLFTGWDDFVLNEREKIPKYIRVFSKMDVDGIARAIGCY